MPQNHQNAIEFSFICIRLKLKKGIVIYSMNRAHHYPIMQAAYCILKLSASSF